MRVTDYPGKIGRCGCGRSPTGKCIGWHGLSDEQLALEKEQWASEVQARQSVESKLANESNSKPGNGT